MLDLFLWTAAGAWLLLELTAQAARFGWYKIWKVDELPGRTGIALHPWLIIVDRMLRRTIVHEKWHAFRQAACTVVLWFIRYGVDGKFRVREEAEADIVSLLDRKPNAAQLASTERWMRTNAAALTSPLYFPPWIEKKPWRWIVGQNPGEKYAYRVQKEALRAHG